MSPPKSIKNGFYKITNTADGLALTVTEEGRPGLKHVVTEAWVDSPRQKWKVKTLPGGLQIIRNEEIKDNEVSKEEVEVAPSPEENQNRFKMFEWNLVEQEEGVYHVNNGFGCLHSFGNGSRIKIVEDCDTPQKWQFEFLEDITKS